MTIMQDDTLTEKEFISLMKQERNLMALINMIDASYTQKRFLQRKRLT